MMVWMLTLGFAFAGTSDLPDVEQMRLDWFTLQPTDSFSPFNEDKYPTVSAVVSPQPIVVHVAPAPAKTDAGATTDATPDVVDTPPVITPPGDGLADTHDDPPSEIIEPESDPCQTAADLEIVASTQGLSADQHACMVEMRATGSQVERNRASRVLMRSAVKTGGEIEAMLAYHLTQIDQSDPSLCLDYAGLLARRGRSVEAIQWTENALEVRNGWNGPQFVERVSRAYSLRAEMAHRRWTRIAKGPVDDSLRKREDHARALAKTAAREWLDYVRSADLATDRAEQLCASAAGTKRYCK